MKKGIDVSRWQGKIDWNKVKQDGIKFAIIRGGYGNNNIDTYADRNFKECNRLGIEAGMYWFSYAYTEAMARQEAKHALNLAKKYKLEYPIYYDFEYDSMRYARDRGVTVTNELLNKMAVAFCEEIEKAGYYAGIYANKDYINNKLYKKTLEKYDLWYARWQGTEPDRKVNLWQYTDKGKVKGISGNVDLDYDLVDLAKVIRDNGLNNLAKTDLKYSGCITCEYYLNSKK